MSEENKNLSDEEAGIEPKQPAENVPEETISSDQTIVPETEEQPEPLNIKPLNENMETHADHLHKAPGHGWKHYVYEFLMLFLAVFCGFLAENQREHYVEGYRAKEYAKSLLNDLKEDTAEISGGILQNSFMVEAFDSCISIGMKSIDKLTVAGAFYYYSRFTTNAYAIDWNRSTLTQLIQSGNLRYFKNKELVDKINKYHSLQGRMISNNETDFQQRNKIAEIRSQLLAARYYVVFAPLNITLEMKRHIPDAKKDSLMLQQLSLKPGSTGIMEEYLNDLIERKLRNKSYAEKLYPLALKTALEIMEMLKEEYRL